MLVSCLLPTYNRIPRLTFLLEEAIECFIRQSYKEKELIICNDTPGQTIKFIHPQVRVINRSYRFPTLGEKLHWMLEQAQGEYICRWDDDDLSLPWRLSTSVARLYGDTSSPRDYAAPKTTPLHKEWRPENHWYFPKGGLIEETKHPGNTHIAAIWHRDIILNAGVKYPGRPCPSGLEDQTFTSHLRSLGYPNFGDLLPLEDIFYMYRWGTGSCHLSGKGGGETMQRTYAELGTRQPLQGEFTIEPRWHGNYLADVHDAIEYARAKVANKA